MTRIIKSCYPMFLLFMCGFVVINCQENTNFLQNIIFGLFNNNTDTNQIGTLLNLLSLGTSRPNDTSGADGILSSLQQLVQALGNIPDLTDLLQNNSVPAPGNGTTNNINSILENVLNLLPGDTVESLLADNLPDLGDVSGSQLLSLVTSFALQASGVGENCRNDIGIILAGLTQTSDWAIRMLDAMGKPESGFAEGNLKWLGDYQQCVDIKAISEGEEMFTGKYCKIDIPITSLIPAAEGLLPPYLEIGTCTASSCTANDFVNFIATVQRLLLNGTTLFEPNVTCREELTFATDFIICICLLAMLLAAIVIGTLYDIVAIQMKAKSDRTEAEEKSAEISHQHNGGITLYKPKNSFFGIPDAYINGAYATDKEDVQEVLEEKNAKKEKSADVENVMNNEQTDVAKSVKPERVMKGDQKSTAETILLAFSFYSNGVKILNTNQAAGSLGSINGIRFLSMAWVILGHTYYFCIGYDSNFFYHFLDSMQDWSFMAIAYATVSVDTFFALSGILVAYLTLKELKKVGGVSKLNWLMFYFHRFWRLTPPYMLVIMVGTVILPYILNGPMWTNDDIPFMDGCRKNWWTNLLYINNYVHVDNGCMPWTWYLANDMQFYIISPLILLPLFYNVIAGAVSCLLFLTATTVAVGVVAYSHRYPVQSFLPQYAPAPNDADYGEILYIPSYARFGPYIIGLFTGYMLYRLKCKCRIPKIVNLTLWLLALAICCVCVYTPYSKGDSHIFTAQESAAYYALHRTGWAVAVCWIVFACSTGYGGWVNEVLSWKAFIPLGRLTYSAYLIHPLVMLVFYMSRNSPTYFSIFEVIYLFLGHLTLSYGLGFIVSLVFESPMMGLEKAIFKRGRK